MKMKPILVFSTVLAVLAVLVMVSAAVSITPVTMAQSRTGLEKGGHKGIVVATMNSGEYTYIQFEEKGKKLWVAAPKCTVAVGDTVEFAEAAPMKDFYSRTLNRKFELILFVAKVNINSKGASYQNKPKLPEGHAPIGKAPVKKPIIKPGSIKKAEKGCTVAECYEKKDTLKGKRVTVRGRVVKFSPRIMGKNWLHIQDGTGAPGTDDLTVTTKQEVKVGDLVLVTGTLAADKNFGAGYVYKVIIEEAAVVTEKEK